MTPRAYWLHWWAWTIVVFAFCWIVGPRIIARGIALAGGAGARAGGGDRARGHIQPLAALMRIGGAYGEPWTWAAVLRYESPTVVVIEGVERAPTRAEARAVRAVLIAAGVTEAKWERHKGDRVLAKGATKR